MNKSQTETQSSGEAIQEGSFYFNDQVLTFNYKPRKDDKVMMGSDMLLFKKDVRPKPSNSLFLSSVVHPGRQWPYGLIPFILDLKSLEKIGFNRSNLIPRITAWNHNPYTGEDTGILLYELILVDQAVAEDEEFQEKHIVIDGERFSYYVRYLTKDQLKGSSYVVIDGNGAQECGTSKITGVGTVFNVSCANLGRIRGERSGIFLGDSAHVSGVVEHEVGHAIGFIHEHNRPDRDRYLDINWSQLSEDSKLSYIINSTLNVDTLTPYDYNSVMHYSSGGSNFTINIGTILNFKRHIPVNSDEDFNFFENRAAPALLRKDNGEKILLEDVAKISRNDYEGLKKLIKKFNENYPPNSYFEITATQQNIEDNLESIELQAEIKDGFFQYNVAEKVGEDRNTVLTGFSSEKSFPLALPKGEYEVQVRACRENFEYISYKSNSLDQCLESNQSFEECGEAFQKFYESVSICGDTKSFDLTFSDSHAEIEKVHSYLRIEELKLLLRYLALTGVSKYLGKTGCNVNEQGLEKSLEKIMAMIDSNSIPLPFNVVRAAFYASPNAFGLTGFNLKPRFSQRVPRLKARASNPPVIKKQTWATGQRPSLSPKIVVGAAAVGAAIWIGLGIDTSIFRKYSDEPVSPGTCGDEIMDKVDKWMESYLISIKEDLSMLSNKGCNMLSSISPVLSTNECQ